MNEEDRTTRLEACYETLQRHVTEQDRVILDLGESLDRLKRELAALRSELDAGPGRAESPVDQRPPHY